MTFYHLTSVKAHLPCIYLKKLMVENNTNSNNNKKQEKKTNEF